MNYSVITIKNKVISDFSDERNRALRQTEEEWVLFLDSDEILTPQLKNEIDNLKPDKNINGYYIKRHGMVEEKLLRLARKNAGKWERCVHETWKIKGEVGLLENTIIHQEEKDLFKMIKKANFYSTLHAKANRSEGKKSNLLKIIVFPLLKFSQTYFIKKAYKKGALGIVFSFIQSLQSFLSWTKLYFLSI